MRVTLALVGLLAACGGPTAAPPAPPSNDVAEAAEVDADPSIAVIVVIDRSGSMMGAKLESAREGARTLVEVLPPDAILGVVAFDSEATIVVRPQPAANADRIRADLELLQPGGGTNYYPGLREAGDQLEAIAADRKQIIFLSDGESPYDGVIELVAQLLADGVSVSTIGLGDADRALLQAMAEAGGGRLYMIEDLSAIPRIMMKEVETLQEGTQVP